MCERVAEHVPPQGQEETGLQCPGAVEITCLAFSSPSQGSFGLEAGRGEQDLSLPSSAAASGARAESGCPEGAVSLHSCHVAEHKALGGRAGARGSTASLCSSRCSGPLQNYLVLSPAVYLLHGLCLNSNPSRERAIFGGCAQHPAL